MVKFRPFSKKRHKKKKTKAELWQESIISDEQSRKQVPSWQWHDSIRIQHWYNSKCQHYYTQDTWIGTNTTLLGAVIPHWQSHYRSNSRDSAQQLVSLNFPRVTCLKLSLNRHVFRCYKVIWHDTCTFVSQMCFHVTLRIKLYLIEREILSWHLSDFYSGIISQSPSICGKISLKACNKIYVKV